MLRSFDPLLEEFIRRYAALDTSQMLILVEDEVD